MPSCSLEANHFLAAKRRALKKKKGVLSSASTTEKTTFSLLFDPFISTWEIHQHSLMLPACSTIFYFCVCVWRRIVFSIYSKCNLNFGANRSAYAALRQIMTSTCASCVNICHVWKLSRLPLLSWNWGPDLDVLSQCSNIWKSIEANHKKVPPLFKYLIVDLTFSSTPSVLHCSTCFIFLASSVIKRLVCLCSYCLSAPFEMACGHSLRGPATRARRH